MRQDGSIAPALGAAWNGLSAPVLALAEELAQRRAAGDRPSLSLRIRSGGIDAISREGTARRLLLTVPGRPQIAIDQLVDKLAGKLGPGLALAFAEDQAVSQQVVLPQQPEDVLRAIVRNKVESLAPWPLAQCLWGMHVSAIPGDPLHVTVDVAVISRAAFDALAATLRTAGSEVKSLSVTLADGEEIDISLGSDDVRRAARARAIAAAKLLSAVLALLLGLGLFWIYRSNAEAARLEQETAAAMAALKPSGAIAGESPMVAAANRLRQQRAVRPPAIAVLDEVTRLLPDGVHLTLFGLNGEEVVLKGQGSGVPELIGLLESSPAFTSANFAAATELDQNSKADSFSISATLETAGQGAAP